MLLELEVKRWQDKVGEVEEKGTVTTTHLSHRRVEVQYLSIAARRLRIIVRILKIRGDLNVLRALQETVLAPD